MSGGSNQPIRDGAPDGGPEEEQQKLSGQGAGAGGGGGGGGGEDAYEIVNPDEHVADFAPPSKVGRQSKSRDMKSKSPQMKRPEGSVMANNRGGSELNSVTAKEKEEEDNKKKPAGKKTTTTTTKTTSVNKKLVATKKSTKAPPKPKTGKWKAMMAVSLIVTVASAVGIAICATQLAGLELISAFEEQ